MPSNSIGFWVAKTVNPSGSGCEVPSTVTRRSCIASSSAAWVLAGARLISSPSTRSPKIGPGRKLKVLWPLSRFTPGDVRRHQVRRELDAAELEPQRQAERPHQERLGGAGHAFEQHVAARHQGRDRVPQGVGLPQDDTAELRDQGLRHGALLRRFVGLQRGQRHAGFSSSHRISTALAASSTPALVGEPVEASVRVASARRPRLGAQGTRQSGEPAVEVGRAGPARP